MREILTARRSPEKHFLNTPCGESPASLLAADIRWRYIPEARFLSGVIHDTIKQRLRASLLLTPAPQRTLALASDYAARLQDDGAWSDLDLPASTPSATDGPVHLARTLLLAKALRPAAGALDAPLRKAFDFWLSHDFTGPDWRSNQIEIPGIVGEIALLYDTGLSPGAADKVMEILARSRWADWVAPAGWVDRSGADLLGIAHNHLLRGCMENSPAFFDDAFRRIFREIRPAGPGEDGIQADMTFLSSRGGMNGGFAFMRECAQFIALAHGTPWQAPPETVKLFAGFLLDGQQWMMRPGIIDADAPNDVFSDAIDLAGMATTVQQLAQLGNPPRRLELAAFAHRLQGRGDSLAGHRHFWRARMSVHQRPSFYASLRLKARNSRETDGLMYILRSGREYQGLTQPADGLAMPGTTAFHTADEPPGEDTTEAETSAPHFSGGISEGDYGLATTVLQRPGLQGKKAWFFFDDSVVSLGADLRSTGPEAAVYTTINRCRLHGPVVARFYEGQPRVISPENEELLTAVHAIEHDGVNYVFPGAANVRIKSGCPGTGDASDPSSDEHALLLQIEHGVLSASASYTYLALPTSDDQDSATDYMEEVRRIEVLANNPSLQAVRHRELHLLGAAFWEPGVILLPDGGRVAANHSCLLLCRETPGGDTRLSISNLTDQPATVHVEYGGQCVCFELAGGPDAGRSVSRLL